MGPSVADEFLFALVRKVQKTGRQEAGVAAEDERQEMSDRLSMDAYYYGFYKTGIPMIDKILAAVAAAGTAFHGTDQWTDVARNSAFDGDTPQKWIQNAANEAAKEIDVMEQQLDAIDEEQ